MNTHITNVTALGAVASPFWLPPLEAISSTAFVALPILGVIWFLVQIVRAIVFWKK